MQDIGDDMKYIIYFFLILISIGCSSNIDKVVQIESDSGIGTGVIIESNKFTKDTNEILILTSLHILEREKKIYLNYGKDKKDIFSIVTNQEESIYTEIDKNNILRFYQKGKEVLFNCNVVFFDYGDKTVFPKSKSIGRLISYNKDLDLALICVRRQYEDFKMDIGDSFSLERGDSLVLQSCINAFPPVINYGSFNYFMSIDGKHISGLANANVINGSSGGAIFKNDKLVGIIRAVPISASSMANIQSLCFFSIINKEIVDNLKK